MSKRSPASSRRMAGLVRGNPNIMPEVHYDSQGREIKPPAVPKPPAISVSPPVPPPSPSPSVSPVPPPPVTPTAQGSNGIAVAALILGILSLFAYLGSLVLGILAVIFGFIGLRKAAALGGQKRGMALAGIILGFIGLAISFLWIYFSFWGINVAMQSAHTQATDASRKAEANSVMTAIEMYRGDNKGKPLPSDLSVLGSYLPSIPTSLTYTTNAARDSYCLTAKDNAGTTFFVCKNGECHDGTNCTP